MMRAALIIFLLLSSFAAAQAENYTTQSFNTEFTIRKDRSIEVLETIAVHFTRASHGIFRTIPIRTRGANGIRRVEIDSIAAKVDTGSGFQTTGTSTKSAGDLEIRIGNADRTIGGNATYRLHYTLRGAITNFDSSSSVGEHAEFYWNVLPAHWPTRIDRAATTVVFPVVGGKVQAHASVGSAGSNNGIDLRIGQSTSGSGDLDGSLSNGKLSLRVSRSLDANEGVTVVLGFPISAVAPPPPDSEGGAYMENYPSAGEAPAQPFVLNPTPNPIGYFIPLIPVFLIVAFNAKRFVKYTRKVQVAFEPPPGIGPMEAGVLMDRKLNVQDLVAGIVSLAQKNTALLVHSPDNHSFDIQLLGLDRGRGVTQSEMFLYERLQEFGPRVNAADLPENFYATFRQISHATETYLRIDGYIDGSRGVKTAVGCLFIPFLFITFILLFVFTGTPGAVGCALALFLFIIVMVLWNTDTAKGFEAKDQLLGLKEFITRSYQRELRYFAKTDFNQALYDKLLPYAIAFNAVDQWTRAFQGVDLVRPMWYAGVESTDQWHLFLMSDLSGFTSTVAPISTPPVSTSSSTSSFDSGGGFSSGSGFDSGGGGGSVDSGGGGGGGGSW